MDNRACFSVKVTNKKSDESSLWHCEALLNVYLLHNEPGKTIEKVKTNVTIKMESQARRLGGQREGLTP